jgi:hypothetical protein
VTIRYAWLPNDDWLDCRPERLAEVTLNASISLSVSKMMVRSGIDGWKMRRWHRGGRIYQEQQ